MGAGSDYPQQSIQTVHPDNYGSPSKKLEETCKRNSKKGNRRCKNCNARLSLSNPSDKLCRACEKKFRLERISGVSTRFVNCDDLDFDS